MTDKPLYILYAVYNNKGGDIYTYNVVDADNSLIADKYSDAFILFGLKPLFNISKRCSDKKSMQTIQNGTFLYIISSGEDDLWISTYATILLIDPKTNHVIIANSWVGSGT